MSLEAVDPVHVQPARAVSGSHTSVDTKIICEYLSEGDQSLKFEFVHPDYKLSVELYGVAGTCIFL
jgi:hypothetical protein